MSAGLGPVSLCYVKPIESMKGRNTVTIELFRNVPSRGQIEVLVTRGRLPVGRSGYLERLVLGRSSAESGIRRASNTPPVWVDRTASAGVMSAVGVRPSGRLKRDGEAISLGRESSIRTKGPAPP
jgi:hypothetical protein